MISDGSTFELSDELKEKSAECKELLNTISIPCIQLESGDAEAFCAQLNAVGVVDGVLSPDGDGTYPLIFFFKFSVPCPFVSSFVWSKDGIF